MTDADITTISLDRETKRRLDDIGGASYDERVRALLDFYDEHQLHVELTIDDADIVEEILQNNE